MKTGIVCHEYKHKKRNHGLKHDINVKLKIVESCFDSNIEQKTAGNVLNEKCEVENRKNENIVGE